MHTDAVFEGVGTLAPLAAHVVGAVAMSLLKVACAGVAERIHTRSKSHLSLPRIPQRMKVVSLSN